MPLKDKHEADDLSEKKAVELRQIAREKGIHNADRYEKHELLEALRAQGQGQGQGEQKQA